MSSQKALKRLRENIDVFDFTLTDEEMAGIAALDKQHPLRDSPTVIHECSNDCNRWTSFTAGNTRLVVQLHRTAAQ